MQSLCDNASRYTPSVLKLNFDDLKRRKEYQEKRDLTFKVMSAETGLAISTLQRLKAGDPERISLNTLEVLCAYFRVRSISELIEYTPDNPS